MGPVTLPISKSLMSILIMCLTLRPNCAAKLGREPLFTFDRGNIVPSLYIVV